MSKLITISPSPHVFGSQSVGRLMYGVILALVPALLVSVFFYGMGAIIVTLLSIGFCVLFEFLIQKFILKTEVRISDGSAMVTGLLLAFNVPSNLPWWIIMIGALIAIGVGKMTFGGLGNNPFNPALVGRVFLLISFPVQMTSYPVPGGLNTGYVDAVTGATPLGIIKEGLKSGLSISDLMKEVPGYLDLFIGKMGGSLGEIAAAALILGFLFMLFRKIITWHIPVTMVGTIALFTGILWLINPDKNADPLFHVLTGGVLLGAIFMATDYVTSPMTPKGMIIYSIGIGAITVIIRVFGSYPEGVSFAILIMNGFVPLINRYIKPKRFGEEVKHG
ncbi:MAG: RnfABCDGE type electron transport complex subunit D [Bacteroidales bacterium]|nr:RnfABCDGE type electron transport complex subunit D [Bacteroidales bacterium]